MPSVRDQVSEAEWQTRVDLAACYRLVALHGWDDLVFTHISARVPGPDRHFLINPYGLLFEEVTASSLVKVDLAGNKVMDTPHAINPAGFVIHSAVHEAREDAHCVIHLHTDCGVAVSAEARGLLPISQQALLVCASLGYHDYEGLALEDEEKPRLVANLGHKTFMLLRNHGTMAVGATIPSAFLNIYVLERSCRIQILAQSGPSELTPVPREIQKKIAGQVDEVTRGMGGDLAWPALLRRLDRLDPSYQE